MNRGSCADWSGSTISGTGFNEAPIHESGKYRSRKSKPWRYWRFNEAPIHESGKSPRLPAKEAGTVCFNEAPIHESGK